MTVHFLGIMMTYFELCLQGFDSGVPTFFPPRYMMLTPRIASHPPSRTLDPNHYLRVQGEIFLHLKWPAKNEEDRGSWTTTKGLPTRLDSLKNVAIANGTRLQQALKLDI